MSKVVQTRFSALRLNQPRINGLKPFHNRGTGPRADIDAIRTRHNKPLPKLFSLIANPLRAWRKFHQGKTGWKERRIGRQNDAARVGNLAVYAVSVPFSVDSLDGLAFPLGVSGGDEQEQRPGEHDALEFDDWNN